MGALGDFLSGVGSLVHPEVDARRAAANAAIQQMQGMNNPQARHWSEQLQANPGKALAAAEAFGGIGQVTGGLKAAQAAGQSGATPAEIEMLKQHGPVGLRNYVESKRAGAELKQIQNLHGLAPNQLIDYYARVDPTKAKALADLWGKAGLSEEDVRSLKTDRTKVAADFDALFRSYKSAATADVNSPEWGQALTILFNQVLQPNSAVLEGEARATAMSLQSMMEELGVMVNGVYNPQSPLGDEGRKRILGLIEQLSKTAMSDYVGRHEGWKRVNTDLNIRGERDLFSRPGYERLEEVRKEIGGIGEPRRSGPGGGRPASAYSVGDRVVRRHPQTGEAVEFVKVPGGWDPVE